MSTKNYLDGSIPISQGSSGIVPITINTSGIAVQTLETYYTITGNTVCLYIPSFNSTSNSANFLYIEIPDEITPRSRVLIPGFLADADSVFHQCLLDLEPYSNSLKLGALNNGQYQPFITTVSHSFALSNANYITYEIQ